MTAKEEAERLIKEFDFRGTPINDALICANEILYEYQYKSPNSSDNDEKIKYWKEVIEELKKM